MRSSRHFRHSCLSFQEGIDAGCLLSFLSILVLALYRHFWQDGGELSNCENLLTRGHWLDSTYQNWQPSGCMMHKFQTEDLVTCLEYQRATFVGDSITRQTFWATAGKLGLQQRGDDRHSDIAFNHRGVELSFIWDPYLNSSSLYHEVTRTSPPAEGDNATDHTAVLFIGGGLWHARYLEDAYLQEFEKSILDISHAMTLQSKRSPQTKFAGFNNGALGADSLVIVAPVPIPVYKSLTPARSGTLTPERINALNSYLQQASVDHQLPLALSHALMVVNREQAYQPDGLHVTTDVASSMADVLLNARCNYVLRRAQPRTYPVDKTCCNYYEPPNWTQALFLNVSMGLLPLLLLVTVKGSKRPSLLPFPKITQAILVLALAICYCYYADRTQLFSKAQKQYDTTDFVALCTMTLILGVLSIRRSSATQQRQPGIQHPTERDQPFLSRHQTDEWKGWMQLLILVYHYLGASKVLCIYQIVRLLVAAYLFMSGFGHTLFFYNRADYSLRRSAAVLIRLNMLSCLLPYVMRTDYLFYYFAPLISFWYVVIYLTMAVGHSRNRSPKFLIGKIFASATAVTFLTRLPGLFESLFYFLEKSCNIHWDVTEWRFRLQLDGFIVYVGMLCALAVIKITDAMNAGSAQKTSFERLVQGYFRFGSIAAGVIATLVLPSFFVVVHRISSKQNYNSWVPYISALPILAFIVLRNSSSGARNFHSSVFAWMGRHSLETFTLQFHIWLAADTKGVLALGILERASEDVMEGRRFDMAVLTIIFLWVCWHVAAATQTLTNWLVNPCEEKDGSEPDTDFMNLGESIPRTKSEKSIVRRIGVGALKWVNKAQSLVAADLRLRLAIIMGIMWLLNITNL